MTNTINFNYNNKTFQNASVAVMNDVLSSDVSGNTMDDIYNTICKYAKVTKEQFEQYFDQAEKKIEEWKSNGIFSAARFIILRLLKKPLLPVKMTICLKKLAEW